MQRATNQAGGAAPTPGLLAGIAPDELIVDNFAGGGGASTGIELALAKKKQTTRMVKVVCAGCGYVARTTHKWLDEAGAPICPCNQEPMEAKES